MAITLGIDLGTTTTLISATIDGRGHEVYVQPGVAAQPSILVVDLRLRRWQLWSDAEHLKTTHSITTYVLRESKRLIGRSISDPYLLEDTQRIDYAELGPRGPQYRLGSLVVLPEETSALVLGGARTAVQRLSTEPIGRTVIGIPVAFTPAQRNATLDAARIAGFTDVSTILEPIAATVSYAYSMEETRGFEHVKGMTIVFDGGGGTVDISVVYTNTSRNAPCFVVQAAVGDSRLGGIDFDEQFAATASRILSVPMTADLRRKSKSWKETLSNAEEIEVEATDTTGATVRGVVTRASYFADCDPLFDKIRALMHRLLAIFPVAYHAERVLMSGGMSFMPSIPPMCKEVFPNAELIDYRRGNIVADGARKSADNPEIEFIEVLPHTLRVETVTEKMSAGEISWEDECVPVMLSNTPLPAARSIKLFTTERRQRYLTFYITAGESLDPQLNARLDRYDLALSPRYEAGAEVCLTVEVNENGSITAHASIGKGKEAEWIIARNTPRLDSKALRSLQTKMISRSRFLIPTSSLALKRQIKGAAVFSSLSNPGLFNLSTPHQSLPHKDTSTCPYQPSDFYIVAIQIQYEETELALMWSCRQKGWRSPRTPDYKHRTSRILENLITVVMRNRGGKELVLRRRESKGWADHKWGMEFSDEGIAKLIRDPSGFAGADLGAPNALFINGLPNEMAI